MVLVVASGVVGRYVYARIPKTMNGHFHTMQEIEAEQRALAADLAASAGTANIDAFITPSTKDLPRGLLRSLALGLRMDAEGHRQQRLLKMAIREADIDGPARRKLFGLANRHRRLAQQRILLAPFQRMFRYWHTFHLPLAIVMLIVVAIHIGVAIAFGYAWTP
jgi:hypothetical protein